MPKKWKLVKITLDDSVVGFVREATKASVTNPLWDSTARFVWDESEVASMDFREFLMFGFDK